MSKTKQELVGNNYDDQTKDLDRMDRLDLAGCKHCGITFELPDAVNDLCWNCFDDLCTAIEEA
jgi:hypothetical protein